MWKPLITSLKLRIQRKGVGEDNWRTKRSMGVTVPSSIAKIIFLYGFDAGLLWFSIIWASGRA